MATIYEVNTFHGGVVSIGSASWHRNIFNGSRIVVDALPATCDNQMTARSSSYPAAPRRSSRRIGSPREPGLAVFFRNWVTKGGWKPPTLN